MFGVLLLALSTTLAPQVTAPERIAPLIPAQHFRPVTIPFEYFNRHIFVKLTLNGAPGMVFMLDSGANSNVLNMRTSGALGLKPVSIQRAKGLGLGSGKVPVAAATDIDARIGGIQVANVMAIVDLQGWEDNFGHREDGILGFPFLQKFVVVVDFDSHELMLMPSKRFSYRGGGRTIYVHRKSISASIPVTLAIHGRFPQQATVDVDTGSDVTLLLYPRYVQGAQLGTVFSNKANVQGYGLGGYFQMQLGLLESFLMGSIEAKDLAVFRLDDQPAVVNKDCVGVIGNSLLEQFHRVVFDLPGNRIIFEIRPPKSIPVNQPAAWLAPPSFP